MDVGGEYSSDGRLNCNKVPPSKTRPWLGWLLMQY